ncbi:helix-turn-helix transcriptional regulator [bacterium]|nr:helix-turn-helix transcriptional regulator [bacterium]
MILKKELGKKIQEIRKQRKLTQEKFAELVGIDPKNVSKIETGLNYPSSETIIAIARVLNVEIYELFVFNDIPYEQMKQEIIDSLSSEKNVLQLYKHLKGL